MAAKGILTDDFNLLEELGSGKSATVFRASRKRRNFLEADEVAVKLFREDRLASGEFDREVSLLRAVQGHPHIVKLYNSFTGPCSAIVMELFEGGDLQTRVANGGAMDEEEIASAIRGLLAGLSQIHVLDIIHRDVKPENVVIALSGRPVLLDFGIACYVHELHADKVKALCGTPGYMAPEVIAALKYDTRADLFSVGSLIYYCLALKIPFHTSAMTPESVLAKSFKCKFKFGAWFDDVSLECRRLIEALLVREVNRRMSLRKAIKHPWVTGGGKRATYASEVASTAASSTPDTEALHPGSLTLPPLNGGSSSSSTSAGPSASAVSPATFSAISELRSQMASPASIASSPATASCSSKSGGPQRQRRNSAPDAAKVSPPSSVFGAAFAAPEKALEPQPPRDRRPSAPHRGSFHGSASASSSSNPRAPAAPAAPVSPPPPSAQAHAPPRVRRHSDPNIALQEDDSSSQQPRYAAWSAEDAPLRFSAPGGAPEFPRQTSTKSEGAAAKRVLSPAAVAAPLQPTPPSGEANAGVASRAISALRRRAAPNSGPMSKSADPHTHEALISSVPTIVAGVAASSGSDEADASPASAESPSAARQPRRISLSFLGSRVNAAMSAR
eukprot:TRINITY_DN23105_c0_g1_i1.p1 TRINITY_DN23105_c0_g1~~TRINITY_DN23105_c0_g1_i1.p1  ORF type:complete len:617 (+),score=137.84 TRINITY_DN23105_c0_g1_i1:102-1952(+)